MKVMKHYIVETDHNWLRTCKKMPINLKLCDAEDVSVTMVGMAAVEQFVV